VADDVITGVAPAPRVSTTDMQPGKTKDDLIEPTPALPKLSAAAELRRQKELKSPHGALEF
jgi:hypothetical protein